MQNGAPILKELAAEYEGRLKITKLDVDENPPLRWRTASGILTLILFRMANWWNASLAPSQRSVAAADQRLPAAGLTKHKGNYSS